MAGGRIFREHPAVQCLRCHQVGADGGIVGPKLDGIGRRQTREQLLESIVWPNRRIAEGFETVALTLRDGSEAKGTVKAEKEGVLTVETTLDDGTAATRTIRTLDISRRERGPSAMPEGLAESLSPRELRDLVEYLATLR